MSPSNPIFEFGKIEHGWAEVRLRHGESEFQAVVSDVTDGLGEFIRAVLYVSTGQVPGAIAELSNEPGYWVVSVRSMRLYDRIDLSVGFDEEQNSPTVPMREPENHFRATVSARELVRDVISAYSGLLVICGADEYLRRWNYPFPQSELDTLSSSLKDHNQ